MFTDVARLTVAERMHMWNNELGQLGRHVTDVDGVGRRPRPGPLRRQPRHDRYANIESAYLLQRMETADSACRAARPAAADVTPGRRTGGGLMHRVPDYSRHPAPAVPSVRLGYLTGGAVRTQTPGRDVHGTPRGRLARHRTSGTERSPVGKAVDPGRTNRLARRLSRRALVLIASDRKHRPARQIPSTALAMKK